MKPSHIGYLVKDIQESIAQMAFLGYQQISEIVYDPYRDIDICFMQNQGYTIELITPKSEQSVIAKLAKKIGVSPYHICYDVTNIDSAVQELRERGYIPTGEKLQAPALGNHDAVFLYHPHVGIVELVELQD